jgi:polyisoprenyl-teichoic acid--peptidoglycan teichoic acid transferase
MIRRAVALLVVVGAACVLIPATGEERSRNPAITISRVHKAYQPNKGKIFVLVIGSDARSGNPNLRADAIHIAGINTKTMRGAILNFPRDSYVNIPGHGSGKINEALYLGGPDLLARTLENITRIRIDYYAMVGFQGFERIIDGIGRVPITLFHPMNDRASGAHLPAGKVRLGPNSALSFARTRKTLGGGDVARTTNQGRLLLALLRKLRSQVDRDPTALMKWIAVTRRHARLDISTRELFRLGILASQVRPSRVKNVTIPVSLGSVGAASVVFIQSGAHRIFERFRRKASL